jgi:hypothetical protein
LAARRKAALEEHQLNMPATESQQRERGLRAQPAPDPIARAHSKAQMMRNERRSLKRQEYRSKLRVLNDMKEERPLVETSLKHKLTIPALSNLAGQSPNSLDPVSSPVSTHSKTSTQQTHGRMIPSKASPESTRDKRASVS